MTETITKRDIDGNIVAILPGQLPDEGTGSIVNIPKIPKKTLSKAKRLILSRVQTTNKFPSVEWVSKKVGISKSKTSTVLKALLSEGFLERKGNRYILSENAFNSFDSVSTLDKAKAALRLSPGMLVLKGVLFIIGSGATYMSIFHSSEFLKTFYTPLLGIGCAIIMIVFNIISAELMIHFYRKQYRLIAGLFGVLLTIGTLFSMGSTIFGLYSTRANIITITTLEKNEKSHELQEARLFYQNIADRKVAIQQDLETKQTRVSSLIKIVDSYTKEDKLLNSKLFDDDNFRLILANRDLKIAQEEFKGITQEEQTFLEVENITSDSLIKVPDTAYVWLGGILNITPNKLQFILSCYPAIFYDIIAPVAFSIILFMNNAPKKKVYKRKKRRKSNKKVLNNKKLQKNKVI